MSSIHADLFTNYFVSTALLDDPMINFMDQVLFKPSTSATYETMVFCVDENGNPDWGRDVACLRTTDRSKADENHNQMVKKYGSL